MWMGVYAAAWGTRRNGTAGVQGVMHVQQVKRLRPTTKCKKGKNGELAGVGCRANCTKSMPWRKPHNTDTEQQQYDATQPGPEVLSRLNIKATKDRPPSSPFRMKPEVMKTWLSGHSEGWLLPKRQELGVITQPQSEGAGHAHGWQSGSTKSPAHQTGLQWWDRSKVKIWN